MKHSIITQQCPLQGKAETTAKVLKIIVVAAKDTLRLGTTSINQLVGRILSKKRQRTVKQT